MNDHTKARLITLAGIGGWLLWGTLTHLPPKVEATPQPVSYDECVQVYDNAKALLPQECKTLLLEKLLDAYRNAPKGREPNDTPVPVPTPVPAPMNPALPPGW